MVPAVPDPSALPPKLLELPQWIIWFEEKKEDKIAKIPAAPWKTGHWKAASATDPNNWTDFSTALNYAKQKEGFGVGFAFKEDGGIVGIDLDHCIDEEGNVSEFASEIVKKAKSYAELSPSGRGIHIFVKGSLEAAITAREFGVEAYDRGRFFTVTGRAYKEAPKTLADGEKLLKFLARKFRKTKTAITTFTGVDDQPGFSIAQLVDLTKLKQRGDEFQGPHPVHGSEGGMNFAVNTAKNTWFCFRHWVGGGPLSWLAIVEGIIECGQPLVGEAHKKALEIAKARGFWKDPITQEIEQIKVGELAEITRELGLDDLRRILGTTIKHDDVNKLIHFLALVLTYTEDSQINISNRGPSSSGKSYIPIEMVRFVPVDDVIMIAYSSPTAFWHDSGEWDEVRKLIKINLERKVLIFLDQPHDELLRRLRPLLSHDQKELLVKITDKREKAGMRTKNVIVRGFPTVFFCTGSLRIDDQEATRNIVLSPETTQEKIREALYLKAQRKGDPIGFGEMLKSDIEGERLRKRLLLIREAKIERIIVRNHQALVDRFIERFSHLQPRHTRDLERLISLPRRWRCSISGTERGTIV